MIPSWKHTGPIKGAIALANGLCNYLQVTLVDIKGGSVAGVFIDPRIRFLSLKSIEGGLYNKVKTYRKNLRAAGGRHKVCSISFCLSSDLNNRICRKDAFTCSSVRGNLYYNYHYDYGNIGKALAFLHFKILKGFDKVTALSSAMAAQIERSLGYTPKVIENFVDEDSLDSYREIQTYGNHLKLVFVGSLSARKQPNLAVTALKMMGPKTRLDIIGVGPMRKKIEKLVEQYDLGRQVFLHGHLDDPLCQISKADVLLLPSLSEGISRSALEALFLGVPCVLRDVDGNRELIQPGYNGSLFINDADIPFAIRQASGIQLSADGKPKKILLPNSFRQKHAIKLYLELINS